MAQRRWLLLPVEGIVLPDHHHLVGGLVRVRLEVRGLLVMEVMVVVMMDAFPALGHVIVLLLLLQMVLIVKRLMGMLMWL